MEHVAEIRHDHSKADQLIIDDPDVQKKHIFSYSDNNWFTSDKSIELVGYSIIKDNNIYLGRDDISITELTKAKAKALHGGVWLTDLIQITHSEQEVQEKETKLAAQSYRGFDIGLSWTNSAPEISVNSKTSVDDMFVNEWSRGYIAIIFQKIGKKVGGLQEQSKPTVEKGIVIRISTDYRLDESKGKLIPVLLVDLLKGDYGLSEYGKVACKEVHNRDQEQHSIRIIYDSRKKQLSVCDTAYSKILFSRKIDIKQYLGMRELSVQLGIVANGTHSEYKINHFYCDYIGIFPVLSSAQSTAIRLLDNVNYLISLTNTSNLSTELQSPMLRSDMAHFLSQIPTEDKHTKYFYNLCKNFFTRFSKQAQVISKYNPFNFQKTSEASYAPDTLAYNYKARQSHSMTSQSEMKYFKDLVPELKEVIMLVLDCSPPPSLHFQRKVT